MENEYINEDNFEQIVLSKLFPNILWVRNKTIPNSKRKFRPDFRNDELRIIIEFNGYQHYTKSKEIINDKNKKEFYESLGFKVIEWPYFIQPTPSTIYSLFDLKTECKFNNYPQGFVDDKCVLPADFCTLGFTRFYSELQKFDKNIIKEVLNSLKSKDKPIIEIFPIKIDKLIVNFIDDVI